ncbi:MAG: S4 domain-containing protein, partial [Synergistaceae bacterium]|nr:S4 domain-containing protein [Synergistaceae bacterium]
VPTGPASRNFPVPLVDLLATAGACSSKSEVRRLIKGGGLYINGDRIEDDAREVSENDVLAQRYIFARLGKKRFFMVLFQ